jgi:hypothetical protein
MRTALFWVITQRVVVISYRRCRTTYQSHLQGSSLSRNVGNKFPLLCVIVQKSAVVIYQSTRCHRKTVILIATVARPSNLILSWRSPPCYCETYLQHYPASHLKRQLSWRHWNIIATLISKSRYFERLSHHTVQEMRSASNVLRTEIRSAYVLKLDKAASKQHTTDSYCRNSKLLKWKRIKISSRTKLCLR